MCCVLWCRLLGAGVCDRAGAHKNGDDVEDAGDALQTVGAGDDLPIARVGLHRFMSIRWMRAMDSENIGQQQPARINPSIEPLHISAVVMQQHFGM